MRPRDLDVDVRVPSWDVVVDLGPEREDPRVPEHRQRSEHTIPRVDAHRSEVDESDREPGLSATPKPIPISTPLIA